jgi:Leucine-rich repeat (LRR) protein
VEAIFQADAPDSWLRRLNLGGNDLSSVRPDLLAMVVASLEEVTISDASLTTQQVKAIFNAIRGDSRLTEIDICENDISLELEPELLAKAVGRLEAMDISDTGYTVQQMEAVFRAIANGESNLKSLTITADRQHCESLAAVEPDLLARVAGRLEQLNLMSAGLTGRQVEAICSVVVGGGAHLRKLGLGLTGLSTVEPGLLARALAVLEEVDITEADLTRHQLETIFSAISGDTKLKKLDLSENDLSCLEPDLFAKAVSNVEQVELRDSKLSEQQVNALFTAVSGGATSLKKLGIATNNLSPVRPDLLAGSMNLLEEADLGHTALSRCQVKALLNRALEGTRLRQLNIPPTHCIRCNQDNAKQLLLKAMLVIDNVTFNYQYLHVFDRPCVQDEEWHNTF